MLGAAFQQVDNISLFYPCEFTPEYIGIPPVFPNEQPNKTIGGGFVDTYVSGLAAGCWLLAVGCWQLHVLLSCMHTCQGVYIACGIQMCVLGDSGWASAGLWRWGITSGLCRMGTTASPHIASQIDDAVAQEAPCSRAYICCTFVAVAPLVPCCSQGFNSFQPDVPPKVPAALNATIGKVPKGYGVLPKSAHSRHLLQAPAAAPAAPAAKPTTAVNGAAPKTAAPAGGAAKEAPVPGAANNKLLPLRTEVNSSFFTPLKVAAGISSSFLAQGLTPANSDALKELSGTEELQ